VRLNASEITPYLDDIRYPVKLRHHMSGKIALEAERELVEQLIEQDGVCATERKGRLVDWRLTKALSDMAIRIRHKSLPIASRTTYKESLGDGRFVHQHNKRVCDGFAPSVRAVTV
jgi:hypothetical protein